MSQQTKPDEKSPNPKEEQSAPAVQTPNDGLIAQAVADALAKQTEANKAVNDAAIAEAVKKAVAEAVKPDAKIQKELDRIVSIPDTSEKVFLKKDEKKRFPLDPAALKGVVVRQTRKRFIDGVEQDLPARDLNEIGIYTPEEFKEFSKENGLFDQQKIQVEVWHKPGQSEE